MNLLYKHLAEMLATCYGYFLVVTSCSFGGGHNVLRKHGVSIFKVYH